MKYYTISMCLIGTYTGMWETFQKYGLGYCDLPTMIWNVGMVLRGVGVKIQKETEPISKFCYIITATVIVMYFFNYHASMLVFVFVGCRETGDVLAGLIVLSISMNSLIGVTKLMYLYKHEGKAQSLMADYIAYDRVPPSPGTVDLLATIMRRVKTRLLLFWAVTMGNGIVFNLHPLVMPDEPNLYDKHVVYGFKYILGITNFPLAVFNIFTCSMFICYATSSITGLLIVTTGYSEGRLLALSQEMRDLWSDAQRYYVQNFDVTYTENTFDKEATKKLNEYIKHRLTLVVESHATIIGLIKKIEYIFRNAIAVEFIVLTGGLITDLLGGLEKTGVIVPFSMMQVGMDCFLGQKLMDASNEFENAVYDCKWESFDVRNRKTVLLILKMSQKTLLLSAGGVATLSAECFMAMYKAVYSAYTALRSTME